MEKVLTAGVRIYVICSVLLLCAAVSLILYVEWSKPAHGHALYFALLFTSVFIVLLIGSGRLIVSAFTGRPYK